MNDNIINFDDARKKKKSPEEMESLLQRMDELEEMLETMDELGLTTRQELADLLARLEAESGDDD